MYTRRGKNRFVIVFPKLGIAVKLPLVHAIRAARDFLTYGFKPPFPGEYNKSLTEHLFKGMGDNWREFTYYLRTRHPFLHETYFSLFGLFNIQRAGVPCGRSMQELWTEIDSLTSGDAFADAHHFANVSNFCHVGDHLKIIDYGHPKTQEIIDKYGSKLYDCNHGRCLREIAA